MSDQTYIELLKLAHEKIDSQKRGDNLTSDLYVTIKPAFTPHSIFTPDSMGRAYLNDQRMVDNGGAKALKEGK